MNTPVAAARKLLAGARFALSTPHVAQLPADEGHEVAFAGRSNSGKSSAINELCRQRNLARTSRTPGRTQHFVVFELDPVRRLVDLPGFGYAKVSKSMRAHWDNELPRYLEQRQALAGLVLLMDIRHPLMPQDEVVIAWCRESGVPLHVLLSKADKLGRGAQASARHRVESYLSQHGGAATVQVFSATKHQGVDDVLTRLWDWLDPVED